jgi:hypothetical protein
MRNEVEGGYDILLENPGERSVQLQSLEQYRGFYHRVGTGGSIIFANYPHRCDNTTTRTYLDYTFAESPAYNNLFSTTNDSGAD